MKETLIQYFEWYLPSDRSLYKKVSVEARNLEKTGFTALWLPPAFKGSGGLNDVGYGVYDLYDLGEFRQKGTQSTKYGTKTQYLRAIKTLQRRNIKVLADIVLNHKMGADTLETCIAKTVDGWNRNKIIQGDHEVQTWTGFTFPERQDKYSNFHWSWRHFTGTDYDAKTNSNQILLFQNKFWNDHVSLESGNYDYIMGCDIDFKNEEVINELYTWGKWFTNTSQVNGFRLDALKNIDSSFYKNWLAQMHQYGNHPNLFVGEYWSGNLWELRQYLNDCDYCMKLLDVPLHYRLQQASLSNGNYDIRSVFDDTLTKSDPYYAVQFVDNHDTQPGQALESWVMDWFKPQAYALILLSKAQCPCVFYGDYYGLVNNGMNPVYLIKEMVWIRSHLLSDNIVSLNDDDTQKACWMSYGPHPVLVILTIADHKEKTFSEPNYAGYKLIDIGNSENSIQFDTNGTITMTCPPGGISVYILESDYKKMEKDLYSKSTFRKFFSK